MNKLIPPTIKMDNPNDSILIYEGLAGIKFEDHVENVAISIFQSWLPAPQVKFNFEIAVPPNFLLTSNGKSIEIKLDGFFPMKARVIEIIENETVYFSGILENPIIAGNISKKVKQFDFSLINFRSYFGYNFEVGNKSKRTGEIKLETRDHYILIHSVNSTNNQNNAEREVGGYIFTNACRMVFKEPASFERVDYLRKRLGIFLSFINGRRSYPRYIKAYAASGDLLWEDHSSYQVDLYKSVVSWMPFKIENPFTNLWANFLSITENEEDFEKISLIIHWYLEANNNSGHSKGAIFMLQTAFEILYNWLVIDKKEIPENKKINPDYVRNRLRTILDFYGIRSELPDKYSRSFDNIRWVYVNKKEKIKEKDPPYDFSFWFTEIRNMFVHFSKVDNENRKKLPEHYDWYLLNTAIFNLEIILLKMMNYKGILTSRLLVDKQSDSKQVSINSPYKPMAN